MLLHLDTDFAGNVDDAFALAMLLGWPEVQLAGVTTVGDEDGRRAGCVGRLLEMGGRDDVPLARGAALALTDARRMGQVQDVVRYWQDDVPAVSSPPGAALDLLAANASRGATLVAIGPATNVALLAVARPEALRDVPVVMMGGWMSMPPAGLPPWGPDRDTNVVRDVAAMRLLLASGARLTLFPLAVTMRCQLRTRDLPRLRAAGRLGALLAHQAELYASEVSAADLARDWPGLPDDLVTFLHDPLTCAVAAGWPGAEVEQVRVRSRVDDGALHLERASDGREINVVVDVDAEAFVQSWLDAVRSAAGDG